MTPDLKNLLLKTNVEEPSEDLLSKRAQAIEKFTREGASLTKFLDLVRLVFSLEVAATFVDEFRQCFIEFDAAFPTRGRIYELKILAYATLLHLFQDKETSNGFMLQLAIINCYSLGLRDSPRDMEIVHASEVALHHNMITLRGYSDTPSLGNSIKSKLDEFQDVIKKADFSTENTRDVFKKFASNIRNISNNISHILDQIDMNTYVHEEEIKILWWALYNHSAELNKPWSELQWYEACMAVGKELSDLVLTETGPNSYAQIIMKILKGDNAKKVESSNLPNFVLATSKDLRRAMVNNLGSYINELTPVHYAISKSVEFESKKELQSRLEVGKIKTSKQLTNYEYGIQIYRERLYLRNMRSQEANNG